MTQGEQFQGEDGERRARRAQERFNAILQRLTWFATAILVLIAGSVALTYWIALKEIDLKKIDWQTLQEPKRAPAKLEAAPATTQLSARNGLLSALQSTLTITSRSRRTTPTAAASRRKFRVPNFWIS